MKNAKIFFSLVLCYSGLLIVAAESQEAMLERVLRQPTIRESLLPHVAAPGIGRLSLVSRGMHEAVEPAITEAMEKAAIWESYVLNARKLDLREQKVNFPNNQAFKDYVIQRIKDFATDNPGIWIELNLSRNNLGNDPAFLHDLLQAIVTTVYNLKIDLADLDLYNNQLVSLPEHLFAGMNNLQGLYLAGNQLVSLPEHIFDGLNNLQELGLNNNQLASLPEHIFAGLNNLQKLYLDRNRLVSLREHLFEGLHNLQLLNLSFNRLAILPDRLFEGLNNLQELELADNHLTSLPERLFKGLNNLQNLNLSFNRLADLSEHLFEGLNNLQKLNLFSNQLVNLPERLFEGLNKLQELYLDSNQLTVRSTLPLHALLYTGVNVRW